MTEWWTSTDSAYMGAIGGSVIGLLGAAIGGMAAFWVPRGQRKSLVLGLMTALVAAGVVMLVAGIVAVLSSQPYHVWYPLVLCGAVLSLVCGLNLPVVAMRYRQAEARKLDAESLRRS